METQGSGLQHWEEEDRGRDNACPSEKHRFFQSSASICWLLLLGLAFPRAGERNESSNPQLPSGAARDSEGESGGMLGIYD